jgi:aspartate aminotransferase
MINPHVRALNSSSTLKLTALTNKLKKEGKDVVNFTAGEPDFDTPDFIKQAAKNAIDAGFTKYTPSAGVLELREAIVKKLKNENGLTYTTKDIIVTSGAKYAIYIAMLTALRGGDEVILSVPYWVSYPEMIRLCSGQVKFLPCRREDGFKINIKELEKAITSKTRMLVMNYPCNPTGVTYTREELAPIAALAIKKNFYVLSDEIYEKLIYDGLKHISFAALPDAHKITLTVNGFSKSSAMTGWRLGYLAGPTEFIAQASKVVDHTTSCASSISQKAGLAALADKSWQEAMRTEFEKRRNFLFKGLSACGEKLIPLKPQGAFYMFCDIRKTGLKSDQFCAQLLEKYLVSCIPADSFGAEGYIRLSFATSMEDIEKGVTRIKKFLSEL